LRAAFEPAATFGVADALQEVELGYLPVEWELGGRHTTVEKYYYPLLRVPFFYNSREEYAPQEGVPALPTPGVATRMFIAREIDRGLAMAGKFWYAYGAMQLAVVNISTPQQSFVGAPYSSLQRRLGIVHIVLTLEDFEEFDFKVISGFFPFLGVLGQIFGTGAFMVLVFMSPRRPAGASDDDEERPPREPKYARVSPDDDGSGEEAQALLGGSESSPNSRIAEGKDRGSSQTLLSTEEGADGL